MLDRYYRSGDELIPTIRSAHKLDQLERTTEAERSPRQPTAQAGLQGGTVSLIGRAYSLDREGPAQKSSRFLSQQEASPMPAIQDIQEQPTSLQSLVDELLKEAAEEATAQASGSDLEIEATPARSDSHLMMGPVQQPNNAFPSLIATAVPDHQAGTLDLDADASSPRSGSHTWMQAQNRPSSELPSAVTPAALDTGNGSIDLEIDAELAESESLLQPGEGLQRPGSASPSLLTAGRGFEDQHAASQPAEQPREDSPQFIPLGRTWHLEEVGDHPEGELFPMSVFGERGHSRGAEGPLATDFSAIERVPSPDARRQGSWLGDTALSISVEHQGSLQDEPAASSCGDAVLMNTSAAQTAPVHSMAEAAELDCESREPVHGGVPFPAAVHEQKDQVLDIPSAPAVMLQQQTQHKEMEHILLPRLCLPFPVLPQASDMVPAGAHTIDLPAGELKYYAEIPTPHVLA